MCRISKCTVRRFRGRGRSRTDIFFRATEQIAKREMYILYLKTSNQRQIIVTQERVGEPRIEGEEFRENHNAGLGRAAHGVLRGGCGPPVPACGGGATHGRFRALRLCWATPSPSRDRAFKARQRERPRMWSFRHAPSRPGSRPPSHHGRPRRFSFCSVHEDGGVDRRRRLGLVFVHIECRRPWRRRRRPSGD